MVDPTGHAAANAGLGSIYRAVAQMMQSAHEKAATDADRAALGSVGPGNHEENPMQAGIDYRGTLDRAAEATVDEERRNHTDPGREISEEVGEIYDDAMEQSQVTMLKGTADEFVAEIEHGGHVVYDVVKQEFVVMGPRGRGTMFRADGDTPNAIRLGAIENSSDGTTLLAVSTFHTHPHTHYRSDVPNRYDSLRYSELAREMGDGATGYPFVVVGWNTNYVMTWDSGSFTVPWQNPVRKPR